MIEEVNGGYFVNSWKLFYNLKLRNLELIKFLGNNFENIIWNNNIGFWNGFNETESFGKCWVLFSE